MTELAASRRHLSQHPATAPHDEFDDITSASVFSDSEARLCKGILFHYRGGISQAVGQCRLGVDHCENFLNPLVNDLLQA